MRTGRRQRTDDRGQRPGFTLIELLVVIAIIGVLAAIALPVTRQLKTDPVAAATHQLMDDLALARRRAIADHTTVYVVFMPRISFLDLPISSGLLPDQIDRLAKGQFVSYALYEKRQIGDQPGQNTEHFISSWRTLPAGTAIAPQKFGLTAPSPALGLSQLPPPFNYQTFYYGTNGPTGPELQFRSHPLDPTKPLNKSRFPFIAFDYKGSLVLPPAARQWQPPSPPYPANMRPFDCVIPITRGIVNLTKNTSNQVTWVDATFNENPPNAWTNMYNHIVIDGPTGRARVDRQEIK